MATKNNRRTLITKRILKESLLELMNEKSISKITIKEICDLSEMSRSTFYLHYQDQFDLLEDIEKDVLEKTFENLNDINDETSIKESTSQFLTYVKNNQDTFGVLLCQPENLSFQNAVIEKVGAYIQSSIPSKNKNELTPYYFSFVMHGCLSLLIEWIQSDYKLPISDLTEIIFHSCNSIIPRY